MVYLYNNDLNQFGEGYWATVDPYRLPGTTVDTVSLPDGAKSSSKSPQAWVGGATDGTTASVGMALNKVNEGQNLQAMKSWFLLDDQIINLGANINGTTAADIETIIDQRQINPATTQMTVDGQVYTNQKTVSRWANINTADPENNVGYIIAKAMRPLRSIRRRGQALTKILMGTSHPTRFISILMQRWQPCMAQPLKMDLMNMSLCQMRRIQKSPS